MAASTSPVLFNAAISAVIFKLISLMSDVSLVVGAAADDDYAASRTDDDTVVAGILELIAALDAALSKRDHPTRLRPQQTA